MTDAKSPTYKEKESRMLGLGLALLLVLLAVPASAGPMDHPGYVKTATCSACHGFAGNSRSNTMPILAGMNAAYLKKALEDYASGKRPSPEMEPFAKQAIALGWIGSDVRAAMATSLRADGKDPQYFFATAWREIVGRKPPK